MDKPAVLGYNSLVEFYRDFEIFKKNPNDLAFRGTISARVLSTTESLKEEIMEEITSMLMESNPREFIRQVAKQIPEDCWMLIKCDSDPFFEV